jgi:hypothetical protein
MNDKATSPPQIYTVLQLKLEPIFTNLLNNGNFKPHTVFHDIIIFYLLNYMFHVVPSGKKCDSITLLEIEIMRWAKKFS